MVNNSGKSASFKVIIDKFAIIPKQRDVHFAGITLTPLGNNRVGKISKIFSDLNAIYTLDNNGEIISIESESEITRKVTFEEVLKAFPHDRRLLSEIKNKLIENKKTPVINKKKTGKNRW